MLWALVVLDRESSYQFEGEYHVIYQSKFLKIGGRDSSFDLQIDSLFLRILPPQIHEPDNLLSCGKEGMANGSIHSVDKTVICAFILTVFEKDPLLIVCILKSFLVILILMPLSTIEFARDE
jgi:hypothetical protein